MLQGHGNHPYQRQQDDALPAQLPAQDFLCHSDVEEADRAAHAAAAPVRGPHSPRPCLCAERMSSMSALHDVACPAPALSAACLVARRIAPALLGCPPAALGQSTKQPAGPSWKDTAQVPPGSNTDAHAMVPTRLWLHALPCLQHLT